MRELARKRLSRADLGNSPSLRAPLLWSLSLLVLVLAIATPGRGSGFKNAPVPSLGSGPAFAIADFDGDHRPDLASVQMGSGSSSVDDYWIQFRFSASARSPIRLVAPAGGLLIEARDVNGDHAIDIVLATAWLRRPVAILLNDGHGGFSRVEPAAFPEAFSEPTASWRAVSDPSMGAAGVPEDSRVDICAQANGPLLLQPNVRPVRRTSREFFTRSLLISIAGRAPPFVTLHL